MKPGNPVALLVDDDIQVCRAVRRLLSEWFRVRIAPSAAYALAILEAEPVDLIVTEYDLGSNCGLELLAEAGRRVPAVRRVLVSPPLPKCMLAGIDLVVQKPFAPDLPQRLARLLSPRDGVSV
ncbi:MAG TPA: response regulator [Polyangiaceae bacterium]|jgi:DNA-binding NtrC family response regulator